MKRKTLTTFLAAGAAVCFAMSLTSCKKKSKGTTTTTPVISETTTASPSETTTETPAATTTEVPAETTTTKEPAETTTEAELEDANLVITNELDHVFNSVESSVSYTTDSDGAVTVKWFKGDEELAAAPIDAGSYKVVVSVAETATYKAETVSREFTISKGEANLSIQANDKVYDGVAYDYYACFADTDSMDDEVKFYKDDVLLDDAPVEAGTYRIVYTAPETDNFLAGETTATFTISRKALAVIIPSKEYDGEATLEVTLDTSNSNIVGEDEVFLTLTLDGADAGVHAITGAEISGYDSGNYSYDAPSKTVSIFKREAANLVITNEMNRNYNGMESTVSLTMDSDGAVTVKWFKGSEELTSAPVDAGTYKVIVSVEETETYKAETVSKEFTISKATGTLVLNAMNKEYDGAEYQAYTDYDYSNDTDAAEEVIQFYKGDVLLTEAPSEVGTYTIVYSTPETDNYLACSKSESFQIVQKPLEVTIPAKVYDGDTSLEITLDTDNSNIVAEDEVTLSLTLDSFGFGTHTVTNFELTGADASDYSYDASSVSVTIVVSNTSTAEMKISSHETVTGRGIAFTGTILKGSFTVNSTGKLIDENGDVLASGMILSADGSVLVRGLSETDAANAVMLIVE